MIQARILGVLRELRRLPSADIRISGDWISRAVFDHLTKPHPKYKIIQNKKWGAALVRLPDTFEEYLNGRERQYLRRKRKRASSKGLSCSPFSPLERIDEMLEVNHSAPVRQERPIDPEYSDVAKIREYFEHTDSNWGVFNKEGQLRAYAHVPVCGEMCTFSRLLGHADDLEDGIMYLLISEVIREMIELRASTGNPTWAMYDTFFGASDGLRYFKERLGFRPYKANWIWEEAA